MVWCKHQVMLTVKKKIFPGNSAEMSNITVFFKGLPPAGPSDSGQ